METKIKNWGNSLGVILPKKKLRELNLKEGDSVEIDIIIKKRIDGFGVSKGAKSFKREKKEHKEFW